MTRQTKLSSSFSYVSAVMRLRATWSRPISSRADAKLAPCMARPNLFSGD